MKVIRTMNKLEGLFIFYCFVNVSLIMVFIENMLLVPDLNLKREEEK